MRKHSEYFESATARLNAGLREAQRINDRFVYLDGKGDDRSPEENAELVALTPADNWDDGC